MNRHEKEMTASEMQWKLFWMGVFKIPMIGFIRPKIVKLDDEQVEVCLKLKRRTKNHLNSMYFGALLVGSDIAGGIHTFYIAQKLGLKVSFAFKSVEAHFEKRAETNTTFVCTEGIKVKEAMLESLNTNSRINEMIHVQALNEQKEVVARFDLVVSVRASKK